MPLGLQTTTLNFETIREIGQAGKNSQVFIANDLQLDSEIVIKKIRKDCLTYDGQYYKEAKILYNHEHPNIAKVNYGCVDKDHVYIAMPLYQNGSLKDLIDKRFLTIREIIRYSIQFLSGLNHIHSKRLMHLDIKPDNIFLSNSNEALLADFGLAKAMNIYDKAEQDFVYGKQLPPEVLTGESYSYPFDIYLSGLTIYKLCNGNKHYDEQFNAIPNDDQYEHDILNGLFPNRDIYLWHIPSSLIKIINKALSPDQTQRHQNALQLINELGSVNQFFDWEYSINTSGIKTWKLDVVDKVITIELSNNGHDFAVSTLKTMKGSGKSSKITEYCIANIISINVKKFVVKALKQLS